MLSLALTLRKSQTSTLLHTMYFFWDILCHIIPINPVSRKLYISRYVIFLENKFSYQNTVSHESRVTTHFLKSWPSHDFATTPATILILPSKLTNPISNFPILILSIYHPSSINDIFTNANLPILNTKLVASLTLSH